MINTSSFSIIFRLKTTILFVFLISSQSCIIINTPGFFSGYKKLNSEQISQIKPFVVGESSTGDKAGYIAVNGVQMQNMLKQYDTAIVYIWSPHCHAEVCYPLSFVQNYCDRNGYKLFVVAEFYDFEKSRAFNSKHIQLYSINQKFYKTDYVLGYSKRFVSDLIGKKTKVWPRQMMFSQGQFVDTKLVIISE